MNKMLIIVVSIIIVIGSLITWFIIHNNNSRKKLELTYKISAGIPFKWVYEIENPEIVELVEAYVLKDENTGGKTGAPIYRNYVFKGLKPGETTITFKIVSITGEHEDGQKEVNRVRVDENLNIYLVEAE